MASHGFVKCLSAYGQTNRKSLLISLSFPLKNLGFSRGQTHFLLGNIVALILKLARWEDQPFYRILGPLALGYGDVSAPPSLPLVHWVCPGQSWVWGADNLHTTETGSRPGVHPICHPLARVHHKLLLLPSPGPELWFLLCCCVFYHIIDHLPSILRCRL